MLTYNTFYQHELKKLIENELERRKEIISSGMSTPDFSAYKHQVGVMDGLKQALELMDEADRIAQERG